MTAGNPCLLGNQEVEASGLLHAVSCAASWSVRESLHTWRQREWQQTAVDRWWRLDRQHRRKLRRRAYIKFLNDTLAADGLDPTVSSTARASATMDGRTTKFYE